MLSCALSNVHNVHLIYSIYFFVRISSSPFFFFLCSSFQFVYVQYSVILYNKFRFFSFSLHLHHIKYFLPFAWEKCAYEMWGNWNSPKSEASGCTWVIRTKTVWLQQKAFTVESLPLDLMMFIWPFLIYYLLFLTIKPFEKRKHVSRSFIRSFFSSFFLSLSLLFYRCFPLVASCVLLNGGKYFTAPKMFCMKICRLDVNSRFCVFVVVCLPVHRCASDL